MEMRVPVLSSVHSQTRCSQWETLRYQHLATLTVGDVTNIWQLVVWGRNSCRVVGARAVLSELAQWAVLLSVRPLCYKGYGGYEKEKANALPRRWPGEFLVYIYIYIYIYVYMCIYIYIITSS